MSQQPNDDELEAEESEGQPHKGKGKMSIAEMKARIASLEEMETKFQDAIRKDAFRSAGVDIADPKAKYFVKGYDGDLTAEAIKAEAEAAGVVFAKPSTTPVAEQQGHSRLLQASVGEAPGPQQWTLKQIQQASREGRHEEITAAQDAGLLNDVQGIE